jgi:hypothetical protein
MMSKYHQSKIAPGVVLPWDITKPIRSETFTCGIRDDARNYVDDNRSDSRVDKSKKQGDEQQRKGPHRRGLYWSRY